MTESQINALYELADIYVSAHHSEGWGLTLSDAMLFRKPVIGTGYSGNLEFMNDANSFLLDYEEDYIRGEDCGWLFEPNMRWAYPCSHDLRHKLLSLYESRNHHSVTDKIEKATKDLSKFRFDVVAKQLHIRLDCIAHSYI